MAYIARAMLLASLRTSHFHIKKAEGKMSQRNPSGLPEFLNEVVDATTAWMLERNETLDLPNWGVIVLIAAMIGVVWGVNSIHMSGVK